MAKIAERRGAIASTIGRQCVEPILPGRRPSGASGVRRHGIHSRDGQWTKATNPDSICDSKTVDKRQLSSSLGAGCLLPLLTMIASSENLDKLTRMSTVTGAWSGVSPDLTLLTSIRGPESPRFPIAPSGTLRSNGPSRSFGA